MVWLYLVISALGKTTPLLLAALGGMLSEVAGVINFALEGMMLSGAFMAVWGAGASGSPWIGALCGVVGGVATALIHTVACLKLRANQIVSSIAINLLAAGLTGTLLNQVLGVYGTSPPVARLPSVQSALLPFLADRQTGMESLVGGISIVVPIGLAIGIAAIAVFRWGVWGLQVRSCGENPLAARSAGLPVGRIRFTAILIGGGLAGLGGAYLAIGDLSQFVEKMTQGRGYLAIAALILGGWRPAGVLAATLLFGSSEALSEWLAVHWSHWPSQVFLALPYVLCLLLLSARITKMRQPSGLGRIE